MLARTPGMVGRAKQCAPGLDLYIRSLGAPSVSTLPGVAIDSIVVSFLIPRETGSSDVNIAYN